MKEVKKTAKEKKRLCVGPSLQWLRLQLVRRRERLLLVIERVWWEVVTAREQQVSTWWSKRVTK
jgi:hypothetical protein